jgi:metal-dependent amidase/aminoacylase/carboxypeptidase family protein
VQTTADINITKQTLITYNDPSLTEKMLPTLEATAGKDNVSITPAVMGAEDFSFYQEKIRAILLLGGAQRQIISETAPHHTRIFLY